MAIDLNKSHYDENGKKIIRTVTPEKEVPEIYPQKEIYPQRFAAQGETNIAQNANNYPQNALPKKRNTGKIIGITLIVIALAVGLIGLIVGMAGDTSGIPTTDTFGSLSLGYHSTEYNVDEVESVVIDADKVRISVNLDDSDYSGKINASAYCEENYFSTSFDDGVLTVSGNENTNLINDDDRSIYITLPCEYSGDITINCDSGDVYVKNLNSKNLEANTKDSDFSVYDSTLENISINSSNGYISLGNTICSKVSATAESCTFSTNFFAAHDAYINAADVSMSKCYFDDEIEINSDTASIWDSAIYTVYGKFLTVYASESVIVSGSEFTGYSILSSEKNIDIWDSRAQNLFMGADTVPDSSNVDINASLYDKKYDYSYSCNGNPTSNVDVSSFGDGKYYISVTTNGSVYLTFGECEKPDISEVTKFAQKLPTKK